MALGVDQAIAELIRDGDPARSIDGLDTLENFRLYDDADTAKRRIFIQEEPPEPDDIISVFLEGGGPPIGGGPPHPVARQPSFSVRARSSRYERAIELALEAYAVLEYFEGTVHGVPFFRIFANSDPVMLGRDRDDRLGRFYTSQTFRSVTKRYVLS